MPAFDSTPYRALRTQLDALRAELVVAEKQSAAMLAEVRPELSASARNLVHYLALRQQDRRALQSDLAACGLSSLGRSEAHVMAAIDAVRAVAGELSSEPHNVARDATQPPSTVDFAQGAGLLRTHTDQLLGPCPPARDVRIMVTLPSEAAHSTSLVRDLIARGMDCARINAAHDDPTAWSAMARNVRAAAKKLGRSCAVAVDLAGPKCRTGALEPGPEVVKIKPERGSSGELIAPARAWLCSGHTELAPSLPVPASFIDRLRPGSRIEFRDARGRRRRWEVASVAKGVAEVVCKRTSYIASGTILHAAHGEASVGSLPAMPSAVLLRVGDIVAFTRDADPGRAASGERGAEGLAHIPCEPPALVDMVRIGESVWLDDGRIGGVVSATEKDRFLVRITAARAGGAKLRSGKGINLPDSDLQLHALDADDLEALAFAAREADIVSLSFAQHPADVVALQQRLAELGRSDLGVILKIETRAGFARLPELLLAAMRWGSPGVMIARGDLAVECGFERLAEVQEEILWFCAAAHVPVVWATQVLETMAKDGRPTRAEVTDAAMAERAECVMLNKGNYIREAVHLLDDILRRMCAHQDKKTSTFRALRVAQSFAEAASQTAPERARANRPRASQTRSRPKPARKHVGAVDSW